MSTGYLLGIDAGQTVTKAVVFDRDGREVGAADARVPVTSPRPRFVERDMEAVWQATIAAIRGALTAARATGEQIAAIGIVGHNDGLYLIDADGRPVRPAITAMDTRAHKILAEWRATPIWDRALRLTGQVPFGGSPSSLLAWILRNEPESLDRARWVLFCKDWLRFRLTGQVATDPTEASAGFTSAETQAYDVAALDLYGLRALDGKLPVIRPSEQIAGTVDPAGAAATGLLPGTPVVTGAHDVDGSALGIGVVEPGALILVAGTFSINQVVSAELHVDPRWQARTFLRPGRRLNMSTSASSATNLDWWRGLFGDLPYDVLETELRSAAPGDIIYHPFLYGSPFGADATAAVLGLRGWHSRADLVRAVCEGVALGHRVHVDALRERFATSGAARLSGGAARSPAWSQLFADALDVEIEIPDCEETGARGAALLAGLGIGWYADLEEAASTARFRRRHAPDPAGQTRMRVTYERFLAAAEALRDIPGQRRTAR